MRVNEEVAIPDPLPSPAPDNPLEALSWLGDTVEEVAEGLRARGIKGKLSEPRSCPLHNYLAEFGWNYSVLGPMLNISPDSEQWEVIRLPKHIFWFVGGFDAGRFPDLIDNG